MDDVGQDIDANVGADCQRRLLEPLARLGPEGIGARQPLAGGLGGWVCYYLAGLYDQEWIMAVALYTFILNLVNLAPIPPLDGSHIWICFWKSRTPNMSASDRVYLGFFLAALIAGLILGCMHTWGNLPPPSSLTPR